MHTLSRYLLPLLLALGLFGHSRPAGAQSAETARREARVRFETSPAHLAVYLTSYRSTVRASAGGHSAYGEEREFRRVCVAPCEAAMPAGTDTYAVALPGGRTEGKPYPIGTLTLPPGNSTARIEYRDRSAIRDVGQFVGLGPAVIGVIYATVQLVALTRCPEESCKKSHIRGAALGGGLFLGGLAITLVVSSIDDGVDVEVTPRTGLQAPVTRQVALRGHF